MAIVTIILGTIWIDLSKIWVLEKESEQFSPKAKIADS